MPGSEKQEGGALGLIERTARSGSVGSRFSSSRAEVYIHLILVLSDDESFCG